MSGAAPGGGPPGRDVVAQVLAGTRLRPGAIAVRAGRRSLRHADVERQVGVLADRLRAEGLRPGDAMLFSVRPGPDAVVLALATVAAGGVVVVADPGAGADLFAARVALARPAWAAAESVLHALGGGARWQRPLRAAVRRRGLVLPDYGALGVRHLRAGPWLPGVPRGAASLRSWSRGPAGGPPPGAPDLDAPALVVFTSGTTGSPRAVVHTRRTLGGALDVAGQAFGLGPDDRVVTDQLMIGLTALAAGATWSLPAIGAPPRDLARHLVRDRATAAWATPAGWDAVLAGHAPSGLPPTVRLVLTGSAPVPAPLLARLAAAAPGARVLAVYGATELLPAAVVDAAEKVPFDGRGDLVGRPLPGVRARIDPGGGELLLAAPHLAAGYLRPDGGPGGGGVAVEPLAELATGDAARLDAGGRIVLTGRLKEMMIRGSMNIYPGLYEPGVLAVPGVADAALAGLPDPVTADERIVLALVVAAGEHPPDVVRRVRAAAPRVFDAAALPDDVVVLASLPRSGRSGKLDRAALADAVRAAGAAAGP